jgi:hypothetical protein
MMDDTKPFVHAAALPDTAPVASEPSSAAPAVAPVSDASKRFSTCRWRATPEQGAFCTHRDVLPFAGKEGFVADSWCGDCGFYKLRRTPKKRDYSQY